MATQSHEDLIQIIDVTFLQHNQQCVFQTGNRARIHFLTILTELDTRNGPFASSVASRVGMKKTKICAMPLCQRGYYRANLVMRARRKKIIVASILTFAYIKQILLYAFKILFIRDSRISSDKFAPTGILEYSVTSPPRRTPRPARHLTTAIGYPEHASLPPADRDTCRVVDRSKLVPPLKQDFVPLAAAPARDIHGSPGGRERSSGCGRCASQCPNGVRWRMRQHMNRRHRPANRKDSELPRV